MRKSTFALSLLISNTAAIAIAAAPILPVPYVVPPAVPAAMDPLHPSAVRIGGWLGARIDVNGPAGLSPVDTEPMLAGYKTRPGTHPWIGEHVGKWLHAATLAWAHNGDEELRRKLDTVVAELIATQEPDGYLGTYLPDKRFGLFPGSDWDVWSHKYNLIGLLTYYRYTGNESALGACRKIGDLLIATFPAKRSIIAAGTHMGMAATSVLEPMVDLYRLTGETRYLDFANYIVRSYEETGGPDIVRSLLAPGGTVDRTANGKAYEMLSNLVGVGKLYQVTGDARFLRVLENAWTDITDKRLYVTGTSSIRELFGGDHELPNGEIARLGETCVTTTWIQLNALLFAQTGGAKYAGELERSLYNHLTAAQHPRGDDWCYYTALEGKKRYDSGITCCHSSGPRGLALAPALAYLQSGDALCVNTLETSRANFAVGGSTVELLQESRFPFEGKSTLTVRTSGPVRFALRIRVPTWAAPLSAGAVSSEAGWLTLPAREWRDGDKVEIVFNLTGRVINGEFTNHSRVAYAWGPFILALDLDHNPGFANHDAPHFIRAFDHKPPALVAGSGSLVLQADIRGDWDINSHPARFVPFADAGVAGRAFAVWLRAP